MEVREFSLRIYKDGDNTVSTYIQYPLNNFKKYGFVTNPEGLGIENTFDTIRIGNRAVLTEIINELIPLTFILNFSTYEKYKEFTSQLMYGKYKAVLLYKYADTIYKRDILIQSISKSEKSKGYLACNVTLAPTSFWYEEIEYKENLVADEYKQILFENNSDTECEIELLFAKVNEFLLAVSGEKTLIGCKLKNLDELEYPYITYSSKNGDFYIRNQGVAVVQREDILNERYVDLEYSPLIQIPARENVYIQLKASAATTVNLTVRKFYITV